MDSLVIEVIVAVEGREKNASMRKQRMGFTINENCTCCGACLDVCPSDAISEGDGRYEIDEEKCEECGSCVEVCFLEAIEER